MAVQVMRNAFHLAMKYRRTTAIEKIERKVVAFRGASHQHRYFACELFGWMPLPDTESPLRAVKQLAPSVDT